MRRIFNWFDDHLLFLYTGFLLAFIPLYPKLPLFDVLPGYIVRARIEDLLVVLASFIWFVQLWRRKVAFGPNPLSKPVLAYLTVGILSMISAVFITRTVPIEALHIGKMALHYLRRIEYFSLFFVFYSSVKSIKQVKIYFAVLLVTILGVIIYGYGQKYLYWPAFSTMNREFSKGWALYLTQHARVLSTFGGHYDLAAFTMVALVILWALFFSLKNKWQRLTIFLVLAGAFWLLILTVSRTSFIAYILGVTVLFGFWTFRKGISWAFSRWLGVVILSMVVMLTLGDLSDRFTKLLKLDVRLGGIKALLLQPVGAPPTGTQIAFLENNTSAVTSKSDFPPLPQKPTDVTLEQPDFVDAQTASGSTYAKEVPRTYSQTALVYDLSTGIRLDALWPRAIAGFLKNPLLGSGYSTLSKTQTNEFTEAESTDNDYLRALGETGLLGFLSFGWIIGTILVIIWKTFSSVKDKLMFGAVIGLAAGIVGLLVNAVYIDIFEASKVAFSFWAVTGIVLGGIKVAKAEKLIKEQPARIPDIAASVRKIKDRLIKIIQSDKLYLIIILLLALAVRHYKISAPLADWHSWRQADTSAVTRNFVRYGVNLLYPRYDDLSSVASGKPNPEGYRFVEFPLYNLFSVVTDKLFPGYNIEYSGRLTSVFASLGTLVFLYLLTRKYFGKQVALLTAFFFAVLPYNIFWSRVILPEPTLVFLSTAMLYFFDKWIESAKFRFWLISLIFAGLALLVKFSVIFLALPMAYLIWNKWKWQMFRQPLLYIYVMVTIFPFALWRIHISQFPEGIPAFMWLFNGNGIRFKGAWFWWIFAERIAKLILGGWGIGLFILGLIRPVNETVENAKKLISNQQSKTFRAEKPVWFFHFWLLGMLLYLAVFATGNVQHDYYQVITVPIICVFLGLGAKWLIMISEKTFQPVISQLVLFISVVFILMFGWYQVRDLYNINHPEIVEAGGDLSNLIPNPMVKVIAPYNGDTAFLYQTGKRGWPLVEGTINEMIEKGANYYVSVNFDDFTNDLIRTADAFKHGRDPVHAFKIIKQTDKFVIIQLVPDNLLPRA